MRDRSACAVILSLIGSTAFKIRSFCPTLLLITLLLLVRPVGAQSSLAAINGTVSDSSGAVIPDAQIALTNTDTGTQQQTRSGATGVYTILNIRPGNYVLEVSKTGFATVRKTGIILQVNQTATLDLSLNTGSSEQTVTVSGQLSPLESSTAELGTVIPTKPVNDLPLEWTQLYPAAHAHSGSQPD